MKIKRVRTRIDGYVGAYSEERQAKPSYKVDIYKKTWMGKLVLINSYYMIYHVFRTIGIKESHLGLPSVPKEYGDVVECGYRFMKEVKPKTLKMIYPSLVSW
jgi:hypothetical protein